MRERKDVPAIPALKLPQLLGPVRGQPQVVVQEAQAIKVCLLRQDVFLLGDPQGTNRFIKFDVLDVRMLQLLNNFLRGLWANHQDLIVIKMFGLLADGINTLDQVLGIVITSANAKGDSEILGFFVAMNDVDRDWETS